MDLGRIEKLQLVDGELQNSNKYGPMKGLRKAFRKLKNTEKLLEEDTTSLVNFVDSFITVTTNKQVVGEDVAKTVKEVNQHKHSKTCRKHGTNCRFNYPRPPAPHTIVVQPLIEPDSKKREKILFENHHYINKVRLILEDEENVEEILSKFDKENESKEEYEENRIERIKMVCKMAKVPYNDYVKALGVSLKGYSVIFARDIDELYSNPYNEEWMRAWDGNLDLQPCLCYFSVSTYIADYYAKNDTAAMEAVKTAIQATNATEIKEKMKVVSNTFLTHRQIGEAEGVYRLIPSLTLSMSNIKCQFVATGPKEERSMRWRRATEKQLERGISTKQLENHDGLWFEQPDIVNKYFRRPEGVKDMCLAQFAKMYQGYSPKGGKTADDNDDDQDEYIEEVDEEEGEEEEEDPNEKFHFIMTSDVYGRRGKPLPELITLKNPYPGEASWMKKRSRPAALRFHKYKKDTDHKRFMLSELMLYYPLTTEVDEQKIEDLYNEMVDGVRKVDIVKR